MLGNDRESKWFETELQRFPLSVVSEFRNAERVVNQYLAEDDFIAWAQEGIAIAQHSFRSWEAASEYFRATPEVVRKISFPDFLVWARWGRSLSADSPVISSAFFRASPEVLDHIAPDELPKWANLGRGLYKGTWKSSSLCASYFEASPRLLRDLNLGELEQLLRLVDILAQRSYDLAQESLVVADRVFSQVERADRPGFLSLGAVLAHNSWRDVKPYFENGGRILLSIERSQRSRFLSLAERIAPLQNANIISFLIDCSGTLGEIDPASHSELLDMAERLAGVSPAAVGDFLRTVPQVQSRVKGEQLARWFENGLGILQENQEGGLAFFRLESSRGEQLLQELSSGVELERIKEVLLMYCRALAGESVQLLPTQELQEKGIGWNSSEQPSTEGKHIFLPPFVERHGSKGENFAWYKVIATHQEAHLEFDSFRFIFDKPSTAFAGQDQRPVVGAASSDGPSRAVTDLQRFFDLFPDRRLASDIFTLVEDGRIDHRVKQEYRGIRPSYEKVQEEAIHDRPDPSGLPMREALMEVLVRLSLQDGASLSVPDELLDHLHGLTELARSTQQVTATVEDSAEATIRIYEIVSQIPNVEADPQQSQERSQDQTGQKGDQEETEKLLQELQMGAAGQGSPPDGRLEREYRSPQGVEFRGEFKPELVQTLENLRQEASKAQSEMNVNGISEEDLKQMLERSVEVDVSEAQQGDLSKSAGMFVNNLMAEAAKRRSRASQGTQFPHIPDDDQSLAKEPQNYLYDEWDFRAGDYKPRWCSVRERGMEEGSQDFFDRTLKNHSVLAAEIRKQFELLAPQMLRKVKHLPDGEEYDFDSVVESVIQRLSGDSPTDKVYWRRNKVQRDVVVAFLLDMSASTAEAIDEGRRQFDTWDFPDDPRDYMTWLRTRREEMSRRTYKRIIDIEKESVVLLIRALEAIGDLYGIYGFSGYGRENVEFYVIKDLAESFGDHVKRRIDKIAPMHATRMGPAIRHATTKLEHQDARTKILFLLSDGRPQDRGYSREGVEKEYAVHDTRMALNEARRKQIVPFCLTVDRAGHDYLKTMCADMGYEVVDDIQSLPKRLPLLYRRLTV